MNYSKKIVISIVILNILFVIGMAFLILGDHPIPDALIAGWFSFTTVELWGCSKIKREKVKKEKTKGSDILGI